jgi:4-hydroxyacetophenone monooxygenase
MFVPGLLPVCFPAIPDQKMLEEAVQEADLRVLLMVLFHVTGDRSWLKYRPTRDVKLIADEDAGLPMAEQKAIRTAAVELLSQDVTAAIVDPGDELMLEMMNVCLGEKVPPEYARLMREEMGFISRGVAWARTESERRTRHKVVIVGAGVSGLALGARLHELGIEYTILERNDDVGGVWLENHYPGAGVDTPNHAYSYSFASPHRWPHYFSSRDEIHAYLRKCAEEFGVRSHIRFNAAVTEARWDEAKQRWMITISTPQGREVHEASVFVSAIGQFGEPQEPDIEGASHFEGEIFHSARWPSGLDVEGKRVAVVGTGASAMQIVPSIADKVASLAVYQRTAQWARPVARYHDEIGEPVQWLMQNVPFYAGWFRFTMWWRYGDGLLSQLHRDPSWPHPERSINRRNDRHRQEMAAHIQHCLKGRPDLISKALPTYPPFAKRILLDNGWYESIAKPNVELVVDRIHRITPEGLVTSNGTLRPADVIVYASGFRLSPLAARLNIAGRGGRRLIDAWGGDNPTAYLGISVPGYPNFFMMAGPNTGLAHGGSAVFQAESQARYISGMIVEMSEADVSSCEVRQEVHDEFVRRVDAEHEKLIWSHPGVANYYKNGAGRIFSAMPFRLVDYWRMTHEPDLAPYRVVKAEQSAA